MKPPDEEVGDKSKHHSSAQNAQQISALENPPATHKHWFGAFAPSGAP
jgi:hypothetical protein